tara:strand:- start:630 stop:1748 length:1119 start_codon:yes stop_codon:yes gene_type:complete
MHLFLLDLFVSLDTLAPIIKVIQKKNKIGICNVNPINKFENLDLYKYITRKIDFIDDIPLTFSDKKFFFIIKIILFLPKIFLKKVGWIWHYIYKNKNFSSTKILKDYLVTNNVKSITFEESIPQKIIYKFYEASRELNIKLIKIPSGINTIKLNQIDSYYLKYCDYYLAPNFLRRLKKKLDKRKIFYFGTLRYSKYWINELKKIYKLKKIRNISVGILNKENSIEYLPLMIIKKNLEIKYNFKVYQSLKPRTTFPIQVSNIFDKNLLTSEVIGNSNLLLFARSSSVLFEGLINNKKIIFLNFLNKNLKNSLLYKYKIIKKIKNETDFYSYMNLKKYEINTKIEKKIIFKKFLLNFFNEKKLKANYINFYEKI